MPIPLWRILICLMLIIKIDIDIILNIGSLLYRYGRQRMIIWHSAKRRYRGCDGWSTLTRGE